MPDYKEIYTEKHSHALDYQYANQGLISLDVWAKYLPTTGSVFEMGCGNGILSQYLSNVYKVTAVDIVGAYHYNRDGYEYIQHDITKPLPFRDNQFDMGISFDVFEHIVESDVFGSIAELVRVSKRQVIAICHEESYPPELHVTVYPVEWWQKMLGDGWILKTILNRGSPNLRGTAGGVAGLFTRGCR